MSETAVVEKLSVDPDLASVCLEAVSEVLKLTAGSDVLYQDNNSLGDPVEARGFQGKIKLSGQWRGEITVAVPYSLAVLLAARFVGCEPSELDDGSVGEGVGEIANQIAGRVATMLSREDFRMGITIPETAPTSEWHLRPSPSHTVFRFECISLPFLLIVSAICDNSHSGRTEQ